MKQNTRNAIKKLADSAGYTLEHVSNSWICLLTPNGTEVDFWYTKHGWIHAREERDGSYHASTSRDFRRRTGLSGATARNLDTLAKMGVATYSSAIAAIRAHL